MADADDTERTDDAAFTGDAAEPLNDATEHETNEQAGEEDGSTPDDADAEPAGPPPAEYPGEEADAPTSAA